MSAQPEEEFVGIPVKEHERLKFIEREFVNMQDGGDYVKIHKSELETLQKIEKEWKTRTWTDEWVVPKLREQLKQAQSGLEAGDNLRKSVELLEKNNRELTTERDEAYELLELAARKGGLESKPAPTLNDGGAKLYKIETTRWKTKVAAILGLSDSFAYFQFNDAGELERVIGDKDYEKEQKLRMHNIDGQAEGIQPA